MLQDWKNGIRDNYKNLDDILNDYGEYQDTVNNMQTLNNMGMFGKNTGMSNFADNFSTFGNDNAFLSKAGGGSGNGLGYIGLAQGALNGLNEGLDASNNPNKETYMGGVGNGIQGFFDVNQDDSDVNQAINGTLSGAQKGAAFGPWGAAIGGVLGLGSSFIDDL